MRRYVNILAIIFLNFIQLNSFHIYPQNLDTFYPLDGYSVRQPDQEAYQHLFSLAEPEISAPIALLVELNTGSILFGRNETEAYSPASLTKIMTVYTALDIYESAGVSMDEPARFSSTAWAENAPPESSLMFLDRDQNLSIGELLLGLLVSSGNDAAMAVAETSAGSMSDFIFRMNNNARQLGLVNSKFADSSGYDSNNRSSALDLARLSQIYLRRWPWVIPRFHLVTQFTYPTEKNLGPNSNRDFLNITQYNRNGLIDDYPGITGLKTGYIDESGYNIVATAKRDGMHLVAVIMGIRAKSSSEGSMLRERDARILLDYGFANFTQLEISTKKTSIRLRRAKKAEIVLEPVRHSLLVLKEGGDITVQHRSAQSVFAPVDPGQLLSSYQWTQGNAVLAWYDQRARSAVEEARGLRWLWESIILFFERIFGNSIPVSGPIDSFSRQ